MRRFFIALYAGTALLHVPFTIVVGMLLAALGIGAAWWLALGLSAVLLFAVRGRTQLARWDKPISRLRRMLVEEAYYVHWCSLVGFVLLTPVGLLSFALLGALAVLPGWSWAGLAAVLGGCYALALAAAFWGVVVRRRWVRVRELDIAIQGLPAAFEGYRLAQLSDLHVGSMCPRERVENWVKRVNALDVDAVVLTGDYVTSGTAFHDDIAEALGGLRARDGVIAIMGNHDYYGDGQPLMDLLRGKGIRLLRNERFELQRDGAALMLAGVDDIYTKRIDIAGTLAGVDRDKPLLVLAHDPDSFPELAEQGADLVLSGHTHWGQVALPFFATRLNFAKVRTPYHAGEHRIGDAQLYVNPGLGTTGPPIRFGTSPEISIIRLQPA